MDHYLNGIVLIIFGAVLVFINMYLFFKDYKWKFVRSSKGKVYSLLPNFIVLFLSIITIVWGIIYLYIVNNQLA